MIDWTKPIEDVNGAPARILLENYRERTTDDLCNLVLVHYPTHDKAYSVYASDGATVYVDYAQIRNKKVKKSGWVVVYADPRDERYTTGVYFNEDDAIREAMRRDTNAVGVAKIEWEE